MMPQGGYLPEGSLLNTPQNRAYTQNPAPLQRAMEDGTHSGSDGGTLRDAAHNLTVELGGAVGIIPRVEAAVGIELGRTREIAILSRVGKPVCFQVMGMQDGGTFCRAAGRRSSAWSGLCRRCVPATSSAPASPTSRRLALLSTSAAATPRSSELKNISVSRIAHPRERFYPKQENLRRCHVGRP